MEVQAFQGQIIRVGDAHAVLAVLQPHVSAGRQGGREAGWTIKPSHPPTVWSWTTHSH